MTGSGESNLMKFIFEHIQSYIERKKNLGISYAGSESR